MLAPIWNHIDEVNGVETIVLSETTGEHVHAVELGMGSNPVDFIDKLGNFNLNLHTILGRIDTVGSLDCQFPDPVQDICGFLQIAFSCLDERNTIRSVSAGLLQTTNLRTHLFGYCKTGSIVAGFVDPQTAGKFLHARHCCAVGNFQVPLSVQSAHVVIDYHRILREKILNRHPCLLEIFRRLCASGLYRHGHTRL